MVVGAKLFLYIRHYLVLEMTALVRYPLLSHTEGSEAFNEYGCCTVDIRVLALFEPNVVSVVILDNQDILDIINLWSHV
jgi:hypothetical protein